MEKKRIREEKKKLKDQGKKKCCETNRGKLKLQLLTEPMVEEPWIFQLKTQQFVPVVVNCFLRTNQMSYGFPATSALSGMIWNAQSLEARNESQTSTFVIRFDETFDFQ